MAQGWICSRCGKSNAPSVMSCNCSPSCPVGVPGDYPAGAWCAKCRTSTPFGTLHVCNVIDSPTA